MNDTFEAYTDAYLEETAQPAPYVSNENKRKSDRFCVYIGPSITGLLSSQQVFRGTKEDALRQSSLAETASRVLIQGFSRADGSWGGGGSAGNSGGADESVVRGSSSGSRSLADFFFFSRVSTPRRA